MAQEQDPGEVPRIDIRSRIAAFSNGDSDNTKANATHLLRPASSDLRKAPSLAELKREDGDQKSENGQARLVGLPGHVANRPRSSSSLSGRGDGGEGAADDGRRSPRLGVKSIIALYGQGQQNANPPSSMSTATSKGPPAPIPPRPSASTKHILDASEDGDVSHPSLQLVESLSPSPTSSAPKISPTVAPSLPQRPSAVVPESTSSKRSSSIPPAPPARPGATSSIAPVPSLPPRRLNGLVAKTDTGSSTSSSSNGSGSTPMYAPYQRKNNAEASSPALPPRSKWAARSNDDLSVRDGLGIDANKQTSTVSNHSLPVRAGGMGSLGAKWASSSSGQVNEFGAYTQQLAPPPAPPPPPQRAHKPHRSSLTSISSSASSNGGEQDDSSRTISQSPTPAITSMLAPPRRMTHLAASGPLSSAAPSGSSSSSRASSYSPGVVQRSTSGPIAGVPASRALPSSQQQPISRSSSPQLAPPPRHIESTRRLAPAAQLHPVGGAHAHGLGLAGDGRPRASPYFPLSPSGGARSSPHGGNARRGHRRGSRTKDAAAALSRDPGAARDRYEALFSSLLAAGAETVSGKRVGAIWRKSRLSERFLGKVWERAVDFQETEQTEKAAALNGENKQPKWKKRLGKEAFVRAMAAIDHELARRRTRRLSRKAIANDP